MTATAIAFNNLAVVVGGLLLHPIVGYIIQQFGTITVSHGTPIYSVKDYDLAFLFIPLCYVTGLLISRFKIRETYCKSTAEPLP